MASKKNIKKASEVPAIEPVTKRLAFFLRKVKCISFFLNESKFKKDIPNNQVSFEHKIGFDPNLKLLNLTLRVSYRYGIDEDIFMQIEVENIFELIDIQELLSNLNDNSFDFPFEFLSIITGIAISHTRALLADRAAGSLYGTIIIPIISPVEITKAFFGDHNIINIKVN